jgi:hypothetical protein
MLFAPYRGLLREMNGDVRIKSSVQDETIRARLLDDVPVQSSLCFDHRWMGKRRQNDTQETNNLATNSQSHSAIPPCLAVRMKNRLTHRVSPSAWRNC